MSGKKGFTLIELLVVVLIIGILAAIALPKYNKAVTKAQWIDAQIRLRALANAEKAYWMAAGAYTSNAADLDIEVSGTPPKNFNGLAIHLTPDGTIPESHIEYRYNIAGISVWAWIRLSNLQTYCSAPTSDKASNSFCASVTGKSVCETDSEPGYCHYLFG